MKKLPLGLNTFSKLRELNCLYVDKTEFAYNLITKGWRYFLSRPRRFGKSLFVSTLKEILTGNKKLFDDLWIGKSDYEWREHGVISLSLSSLDIKNIDLFEKSLCDALQKIAEHYSIDCINFDHRPQSLFMNLIEALHKKYGKVAILIDEYDAPLLRILDDQAYAIEIRDILRDFFIIIKDLDANIDFVFITGVSSFAKAGIFSGLNNLQILTLDDRFGAILGCTDEEVDHCFKEYIQAWSEKKNISYQALRQGIKAWYNGYRFGYEVESVYNPFSLINALDRQDFKNFWMQSGTPKFLIDVLKKEHHVFDHEKLEITEDSLGIFDVGATPLMALMFQSGYLTIVGYDDETKLFKLDYPNAEVRVTLQKYLLEAFARLDAVVAEQLAASLRVALNNIDMEEVVSLLKQLFAHIPNQFLTKEEKCYHTLLQMLFIASGIKAQSEYATGHGRIDMVLELPKLVYIIEVKLNESAEIVLAQIEEKRYSEPFLKYDKPILLLGLAFKRGPGTFDITYAMKQL